MKLNQVREFFTNSLQNNYPQTEITSFYYIFCEQTLDLSKVEIALNKEFQLTDKHIYILTYLIGRLQKNEPIQYIYGITTFYDLPFYVNPHVLIPRPETEELVDQMIQYISKNHKNQIINILDIGTGSGCIAISLVKNVSKCKVWALDISKEALETAQKNAELNKVSIQFMESDILNTKTLPKTFDVIVSNPPYVRNLEKQDMQPNVLLHEPSQALFVTDEDPLVFYRKISQLAFKNLHKNGALFFEINQYLGKETRELVQNIGFKNVVLQKDFLGNNRFIFATKL